MVPSDRKGRPEEIQIREIDPTSKAELEWVATRMRQTLVEVLGPEKGGAMYTLDWLKERVLFHLDPLKCVAKIYLAVNPVGQILGHSIVRIESEGTEKKLGLFSTTYVEPDSRNQNIASALLVQGEGWMISQGLDEAATYTDELNTKLIGLYRRHGYEIVETFSKEKMIKIAKSLGKT